MEIRRSFEYLKLAGGLLSYLRRRTSVAEAEAAVRARLAARPERLLHLLERGVYGAPASPYRKLLLACGFPWNRVREMVSRRGVEAALAELRDAGVFVRASELKGSEPIERPQIRLEASQADFDNPARGAAGVDGRSSGTTAPGARVAYNWAFLAEEAENEALLYACHGLGDAPTALWYPVHVSIAGIHNLLLDLRRGRPPVKWFSQSGERGARDTAMRWLIAVAARANGMRAPAPETAAVGDAGRVAEWISRTVRASGSAVLRAFASSGVRAVQAGIAQGLDLRGCAVFAGGEPLGEAAAAAMREAGVRAIPRYVSTETGLVGAACPECRAFGEMHVYRDRLAVIPDCEGDSLLVTTLTPHGGKLLLNASLGDRGVLTERRCGCPLGELGMDLFVRGVGSAERFTQQGMTVELRDLESIVGELVREAGGGESDFQFWDHPSRGALSVALDPSLGVIDEEGFVSALFARLRERGPGGKVAAAVWEGAAALRIVRAPPRMTGGHKLPRRIRVD